MDLLTKNTMANSTENVKHKPSKKVVLEDVLTSLQDLVANEFAGDFADASRTREAEKTPNVLNKGNGPGSAGLRKRGRPRKHPLPPASAASTKSGEKAVSTARTPAELDSYTYSQEQADLFGEVPPAQGSAVQPAKKVEKAARKPVSKSKQATAKPVAKKIFRTELETAHEQTNLKIVGGQETAPRQESKQDDMANKPLNTAEHLDPGTPALDWADDIPVLTEIVDPRSLNTEALEMQQLQDVVDRSLQRKDLAPEAREIAVKVAAKLNIEMRESGKQLDVKTIMRLQALLKEALEPRD